MDSVFVLLFFFTEIILLGIAWSVFKRDFISPSVVTLAMFTLSTACFVYNIHNWKIIFTFRAYSLFTLSFLLMIGIEKWVSKHRIIFGKADIRGENTVNELSGTKRLIYIPEPIDMILFLFFVFCGAYYIYRVYRYGMELGARSLLWAIGYNKEEGDYDELSRLLYNFIRIAGYVYIVVFCNNVIACGEKIRKNWKNLFIILLALLVTFFSGQRSAAICYGIGIVVAAVISLHDMENKGQNVDKRKFLRKLILVAIVVVILFFLSSNIVKAKNVQRRFVEYMTYYFGSTVALMGRIVENPNLCHTPFVGYFGEKTFRGFWTTMYSWGVVDAIPAERRWINMGGRAIRRAGNEYTFFCGPYIDFGFVGTLVFICVFYAVFAYIYYWKIRKRENSVKRTAVCSVYIFLYAMIAMSFYMDLIRTYFRPINALYVLYIVVFCKLFLRVRVKENVDIG